MSSAERPGVSVVAALTIPDFHVKRVFRLYDRLRRTLPKEGGEVKGRMLNEEHVASVVEILRRNSAILELVAIDLNLHKDDDVTQHKLGQGRGIVAELTDDHHPNIHKVAADLKRRVEEMPNQLYAQSQAMFELVANTLRHATLYYVQRWPAEVGNYHWVLDGKGANEATSWEDWWSMVVMPILQSRSIRDPHPALEDADYSHFQRFVREIPEWLPEPEGRERGDGIDLRLVLMEDFRFSREAEPGIELVDILANAARRALVGNLGKPGWESMPALMIHRDQHYIRLIALHDQPIEVDLPYQNVISAFTRGGRTMLAPRFCD